MGATMTLENLLTTLSKNDMLSITLVDNNEEKLITFNVGGYANVENDLFVKIVNKITVESNKSIIIKIVDA